MPVDDHHSNHTRAIDTNVYNITSMLSVRQITPKPYAY